MLIDNLKSISEFNEGIENIREAKQLILNARIKLLEARKEVVKKLKNREDELKVEIHALNSWRSRYLAEFQKECGEIGHSFASKKQKVFEGGTKLFSSYSCKVLFTCDVCGKIEYMPEKTKCKANIKEEHLALKVKYISKLVDIEKQLKKLNEELLQITKQLRDICAFFGHDLTKEQLSMCAGIYDCPCCNEEFVTHDFFYKVLKPKTISDFLDEQNWSEIINLIS